MISKYWAAEQDPSKLLSTLKAKEASYYQAADRRGLFEMCRSSYAHYFGLTSGTGDTGPSQWSTQMLRFAGENGEHLEMAVNEYRSFVDQIVSMMTKDRPAFQCEAQNTDHASMAQVNADDAMVTYYYEGQMGERKEKELAKLEILYGKSYQHSDWDPDAGPKVEIDDDVVHPDGTIKNKQKVPSGEFEMRSLNWWEVISEPYRSEYNDHKWRLVVLMGKSKAEAQLRWPAYADAIQNTSDTNNEWSHRFPGARVEDPDNEDEITYRVFYHKPNSVLPKGRKCIFVGDVWVNPDDSDLPIDEIPVTSLMSCELHGTSFGISEMWNMLPLEDMQNQVLSDIATNMEAFGRPPIVLPEGADIDLDALANGQRFIFIPPDVAQPAPMRFPEIPSFSPHMLEIIKGYKQSITQLNSVVRGDTSHRGSSGAQDALYEQIAIEAQSPRQLELDLLREATGNILLQYLKAFAKHPQLVSVVGIDERPYLKTFQAENFAGVARVRVKTANPATKTIAGKTAIADMLRQFPGMPLSDPQQIIELMTTGKMKPMINLTHTIDLRVRWENEQLLTGPAVTQVPPQTDPNTGEQISAGYSRVVDVPAMAFENIQKHLVAHLEVVYSPEARERPEVMQAVLAHIQEHFFLARNVDPFMAQVLGNPVDQSGQDQQQPEQPPGGTPAGGQPTPKVVNNAQKALTPPDSNAQDDSGSANLPKPAKPPGRPSA
jgi:hypothetical protein